MRTITDHIVDGDVLQNQLTIAVTDEPGAGGACHRYEITGFDTLDNASRKELPWKNKLIVLFQNGPIKEDGVNGITQEALLAVVIDRLRSFQLGPFACEANQGAWEHCEAALDLLQQRTRDRIARGVEGQTKA